MKTKQPSFLRHLLTTTALALITLPTAAFASEADIHIPSLDSVKFAGLGGVSGHTLMMLGIVVCAIGAMFGIVQYPANQGASCP